MPYMPTFGVAWGANVGIFHTWNVWYIWFPKAYVFWYQIGGGLGGDAGRNGKTPPHGPDTPVYAAKPIRRGEGRHEFQELPIKVAPS